METGEIYPTGEATMATLGLSIGENIKTITATTRQACRIGDPTEPIPWLSQ